jgi:hypothetical protein
MPTKNKDKARNIKLRDLKPKKDAKGGLLTGTFANPGPVTIPSSEVKKAE